MYDLTDTIVAVSSPTSAQAVIIRITGLRTSDILNAIVKPKLDAPNHKIITGRLRLDDDLLIDADIYLFPHRSSYTGEPLAEIHFWSNPALTEAVVNKLLTAGCRTAEPGEFTARAYLNGKMDLSQAEAVNNIIMSSNRLQLSAAEKLLAGRLTQTAADVAKEIIDCLSLLEAGMDFSEQDIRFVTKDDAIEKISAAKTKLDALLSGSITFEAVMDLPSVGIAGAVNAGKSSLLNALLGRQRSIVSPEQKTTRDILTGIIESANNRYVLFDCAGLITQPQNQIDILAQAAAVEALNNADVVIFCVDITKADFAEDAAVFRLFDNKSIIAAATKVDLINKQDVPERLELLKNKFSMDFLPVSSINGLGLVRLTNIIDEKLLCTSDSTDAQSAAVALTARHRQSVGDAVTNLAGAIEQLRIDNDEVAAMLLRAAFQSLATLEHEHVDEKILDNIFGRFCIGK
ncbi:MAG: GTPase [Phycisphaerae bacterium]|jgi:tRNA modification GTPase